MSADSTEKNGQIQTVHVLLEQSESSALADILELLEVSKIQIKHIDAEDLQDTGMVSVKVDEADRALSVLTKNGYTSTSDDVVVTYVNDKPGALAALSQHLSNHGIETSSIRILSKHNGVSTIGLVTSDNEYAYRICSHLEDEDNFEMDSRIVH